MSRPSRNRSVDTAHKTSFPVLRKRLAHPDPSQRHSRALGLLSQVLERYTETDVYPLHLGFLRARSLLDHFTTAEFYRRRTSTTMAEVSPKTAGGQTPNEDTVHQSHDFVPMNDTEQETAKVQSQEGPSIDEPAAQSGAAAADADAASKGKDKGEQTPPPVEKQKEADSLSIEPSDLPPPAVAPELPVCAITLLLPTGARHPYRIDEKYLAKRNVDIPDVTESGANDPFSISIYKLKELILREWREEWDGKPASPSSIRLIHFGKLLDDKEQLKSEFCHTLTPRYRAWKLTTRAEYQFSMDNPNVVHMSVRPAEMMEEEEAGKGKTSTREGRRNREGGGGCCVIL